MVFMGVTSIKQAFDGIIDCPIELAPLTSAVTLSCGHNLNQAAAENLFGQMIADACEKRNIPCPLCRKPVTSYTANHLLRDLMQRLTRLMQAALPLKRPLEIPENCPEVEVKRAKIAPDYPGPAGKFIHKRGNWTRFDSGASLERNIEFVSLSANSLIKRFTLLGYKDKSVAIMVHFKKNNQDLVNYFSHHAVIIGKIDKMLGSYKSANTEELKTLFAIIAQHNEIPASHYQKVKEIVEQAV